MSTNKPTWHTVFLQVYQRLLSHYGATVSRGSTEEQHIAHAKNWQMVLNADQVKSDEMMPALDKIIKSQRFRTFAPNPAEFVGFVYKERARLAYGIPDTEDAFRQACGTSFPVHPLAGYVRNQIGGWYLRTHEGSKLRSLFTEKYDEAVEALAKGDLILPENVEDREQVSRNEEALSAGEISARLNKMMGGGE